MKRSALWKREDYLKISGGLPINTRHLNPKRLYKEGDLIQCSGAVYYVAVLYIRPKSSKGWFRTLSGVISVVGQIVAVIRIIGGHGGYVIARGHILE